MSTDEQAQRQCLRLLSYNIQVGLNTARYSDYVTRSWRYIAPVRGRHQNLNRIANLLRDYDIVGLQETDAGSVRSNQINQVEYLAQQAGFPHWEHRVNRDMGRWAQHSLGMLSRIKPLSLQPHALPGRIKGRGALLALFGSEDDPLAVIVTHLALSQRARQEQLTYLSTLVNQYRNVVLMGDTNCGPKQLLRDSALADTSLQAPDISPPTYPSWRPRHSLDHILVSDTLKIRLVDTLKRPYSDHLPIAMEIELPTSLQLPRAA